MLNFEFFGFLSTSTVRLHKHQHHRAKTKFRHISRISTRMVWSPGCDDLWLVIDWRPRWKSRNSLCPSVPSVKRRRDSACDAKLAKQKETSHTNSTSKKCLTLHTPFPMWRILTINTFLTEFDMYTDIIGLWISMVVGHYGSSMNSMPNCQTVKWFPVVSSS